MAKKKKATATPGPDKKALAVELYRKGFNCAQSVLGAYAEDLGLAAEEAARVAAGFGGGMGRMGGTCGAVTGAFMVLGLKYGHASTDDQAAKDRLQALIEEFTRQFRARHRSLVCKELLGCDIGAPAGLAWARANNLFKTRCVKYVEDAAEILEGMITGKPVESGPAD